MKDNIIYFIVLIESTFVLLREEDDRKAIFHSRSSAQRAARKVREDFGVATSTHKLEFCQL